MNSTILNEDTATTGACTPFTSADEASPRDCSAIRTCHDYDPMWLTRALTPHNLDTVLLGISSQMTNLRRIIISLSDTAPDVLIEAEPGTGKELLARALHILSPRRNGPFVRVDCGDLPEAILEAKLFGYRDAALGSQTEMRTGKLASASGGTLLLVDIDRLALSTQGRLLDALRQRQTAPSQSDGSGIADVRVIATTKRSLRDSADEGKLRADLYYLLGIVELRLPPLRHRPEDIALLFEHYVSHAAARHGRSAVAIRGVHLAELTSYSWPGNVRELCISAERYALGLVQQVLPSLVAQNGSTLALPDYVDAVVRAFIVNALRRHSGRVADTAVALGIPSRTLYDKLRKLEIAPDIYRALEM
jgi:two-component system C4-dicarboxylate transport response regulator DctD